MGQRSQIKFDLCKIFKKEDIKIKMYKFIIKVNSHVFIVMQNS